MRLLKGYLNVDPAAYDLQIRDVTQPFFDFLNIRYVYVPPDQSVSDLRFVERYRGDDGIILENLRVLPRYFFVSHFRIEPDFDKTVWFSRDIKNFRTTAFVDHIPAKVLRAAPGLANPRIITNGGDISVRSYTSNTTLLDVNSNGWNLLVSSDVDWRGWRAYWNGKRQPPVVVNGAFLGCFVPPGSGRLLLTFRPDAYTNALRISALAGLAVATILAVWILVARRGRTASP
jgi:hypothetical protein